MIPVNAPAYARIFIAKHVYAMLDYEDAQRCAIVDWHPVISSNTVYAKTYDKRIGKNQRLLHRFIIGAKPDEDVDHANGNGLDCRRRNLRVATPSQNGQNRFVRRDRSTKSSKFKGVSWSVTAGRWLASIALNGERQHLGSFDNEQDAARSYDEAAIRLFGAFARTNLMMGLFDDDHPIIRNQRFEDGWPIIATPLHRNESDPNAWLKQSSRTRRLMRSRRGRMRNVRKIQKGLG